VWCLKVKGGRPFIEEVAGWAPNVVGVAARLLSPLPLNFCVIHFASWLSVEKRRDGGFGWWKREDGGGEWKWMK